MKSVRIVASPVLADPPAGALERPQRQRTRIVEGMSATDSERRRSLREEIEAYASVHRQQEDGEHAAAGLVKNMLVLGDAVVFQLCRNAGLVAQRIMHIDEEV